MRHLSSQPSTADDSYLSNFATILNLSAKKIGQYFNYSKIVASAFTKTNILQNLRTNGFNVQI